MKKFILLNTLFLFSFLSQAQPVVDLGPDLFPCDNISLDAANTGSTFLWSTGATNQIINVTSSGIYWVDVTDGMGTTRDSIEVTIVNTPSAPVVPANLSVCEGYNEIPASNSCAQVSWWDAPSGGNVLALGDTLKTELYNSTTLYAECMNSAFTGNVGKTSTPNTFASTTKGITFDAHSTLTINFISFYANNDNTSFLLELKDNASTTLYSQTITIPVGGSVENVIPINWEIPPGTDYLIRCRAFSGGKLTFAINNNNFPYEIPNVISLKSLENGSTVRYYYLYDWVVSQGTCTSSRSPINTTVFDYPTIELGNDTSFCNVPSYTLDAGNPGASYSWSTGATSQTIIPSTTDTYSITATNGGICSTTDEINLEFLQTPPTPSFNSLFLCSPEEILVQAPSEFYNVYESPSAMVPIASGQEVSLYPTSTTTYYVEGAAQSSFTTGPDQAVAFNPSDYANFIISTIFDASAFVILDSIAVYVDGPSSFDIVLTDNLGNILESKTFNLSLANTKTFLPLNFSIPPGTDYYLKFENLVGGKLVKGSADTYPFTSANGLFSITGNSISSTTTYYFYDWHTSSGLLSCVTPRVPYTIDVQHPVDLPDSMFVCNSVVLDATSTNATYLWSTGATTPTINVTSPGTYTVEVTDNVCTAYDTVIINMPTPVGLAADGVLCGTTLSTNYTGTGATFNWSTGDVSATTEISNPGTYTVVVIEPGGCFLLDTINVSAIEPNPVVDLGNPLDTFCMSTTLDAGFSGYTYLWNTGATGQTISPNTDGIYAVTVTSPNNCSGSDVIDLTFDSTPSSDFSYMADQFTVDFTNLSTSGEYLWDFGDGSNPINYPDPSYIYASDGVYNVTLTTTNSCGSDSYSVQIFVPGNIGIKDINPLGGLQLVPNPASNRVQIQVLEYSTGLEFSQLEITNLAGQSLLKIAEINLSQGHTLDVSSLSPGLYFLRVQTEDKQAIYKLLIH